MPIRGSVVEVAPTFEADLAVLRSDYPDLEDVVEELKELLTLEYDLPHMPVGSDEYPGVCAVLLDYPPAGSPGRGRFLVTYHSTEPRPGWTGPYRTFTLLTITER